MSDITLTDMSAPAKAKKAARLATLAKSQKESPVSAISPASTGEPVSQPEKPVKRTVSGIDRNIAATQDLIDRMKGKIEAHRGDSSWEKDGERMTSLEKTLANLGERMDMLKRLRAKEVKYDDR